MTDREGTLVARGVICDSVPTVGLRIRIYAVIFTAPAESVFPLRIFSRPKLNIGRQKSNFLDLHFLSKFHPFSITLLFCTHREKIDLADSEKRTPEVKFRLFFSTFQKITFS